MPGIWPGMSDAGSGNVLVEQALHSFQRPAMALLTSSPKLGSPEME